VRATAVGGLYKELVVAHERYEFAFKIQAILTKHRASGNLVWRPASLIDDEGDGAWN
jgi:hypothetical protein